MHGPASVGTLLRSLYRPVATGVFPTLTLTLAMAVALALAPARARVAAPVSISAATPPGPATRSAATAATPATAASPAPRPASPGPQDAALAQFDEPVLRLLAQAKAALDTEPRALVVDPLIDARTGAQTRATAAMGTRLQRLARQAWPEVAVRPLSSRHLSDAPLLLVGTLNPASAGGTGVTDGAGDFRLLVTVVDLATGRSVAGTLAEGPGAGLDVTPLPWYRDSPTWHRDRVTDAYVRTVRTGLKPGECVDPLYLLRLPSAAFAREAIDAWHGGRWADAYALFRRMDAVAEYGDLRALNGLVLGATKLGRAPQARAAMARIVETGLDRRQLPLRLTLARTGAAARNEAMWLHEAARGAARKRVCLHVALPDAPDLPLDAAARRRADFVTGRLVAAAPQLKGSIDADLPLPAEATAPGLPADPARPGVELRVIDCR